MQTGNATTGPGWRRGGTVPPGLARTPRLGRGCATAHLAKGAVFPGPPRTPRGTYRPAEDSGWPGAAEWPIFHWKF